MERLLLIASLEIGGLGALVFIAWWVDRLFKRTSRELQERSDDQDKKLAVVSADLALTRMEVSRLRSELTAVRCAVECIVEGPPSTRARSQHVS